MPAIAERRPRRRPRGKLLHLNLGCGDYPIPGFVNIDCRERPGVDRVLDLAGGLPFPDESADLIVAHHFLEHLTYAQGDALLAECRRVLAPDGRLSLVTPDFGILVKGFQSAGFDRRFWASYLLYPEEHGQTHRAVYDRELLVQAVAQAGFRVAVLATPTEHLVADVDWQVGITAIK